MERNQLLKLSARDIYGQAVRAGIEVAVKHQDVGIEPDALEKWYQEHPEFTDSEVKALMEKGAAESLADIIQKVSEIPGVGGIFNFNGQGGQFYETGKK